jgi:hypothetical protein
MLGKGCRNFGRKTQKALKKIVWGRSFGTFIKKGANFL